MPQTSTPSAPAAPVSNPAEGGRDAPPSAAPEVVGGKDTAAQPQPSNEPETQRALAAAENGGDSLSRLQAIASGNDGSRQAAMAAGRGDGENEVVDNASPVESPQQRLDRVRREVKLAAENVDIPENVLADPRFQAIYRSNLRENAQNKSKNIKATGIESLTSFYNTPEGQVALQSNEQFAQKKQEIAAQLQGQGKQATEQEVHKLAVDAYLKEKYGAVEVKKDSYKNDYERQNADYRAQRAASENHQIKSLDLAMANSGLNEEQLRRAVEQREELWQALYNKEYYSQQSTKKDRWVMLLTFIISTLIAESKTFVFDNVMPGQRR